MASSESSMESDKAFSMRVKKTFGSLFATLEPSPSSLSNPLWSLTDSQVQKKEWRRDIDDSRDSNPCSSNFDDFLSHARRNSRKNLKNYRKELQDDGLQDLDLDIDIDDDEEEDDEEVGGVKGGVDDWDVKGSIGLDSTLDNEEEEDNFDKVALGRENAGDRLYMKDVTGGHDADFSSMEDLPCATGIGGRDPRANRRAARIRLREDDAEAAAWAEHKPEQCPSTAERVSAMSAEGVDKLKPILKRKERELTSKPSKRVRFDPVCINSDEEAGKVPSNIICAETITQAHGSALNKNVAQVPDYVQNPSKYRRYTLDSANEMSDKSNVGAYEMMNQAKNAVVLTDLPKSVTFVPKKKSDTSKDAHSDVSLEKGSDVKRPSFQSTFLDRAAEEQESEVGDMEVDEPETSAEPEKDVMVKKLSRQYRKPQADESA